MEKDTKTHIITVALQLFEEKGLNKVSLNEVIKASGLSKGAFYHHFKDKKELTSTCIHYYWEDMSNNVVKLPIQDMSLKDALSMILQQFDEAIKRINEGNDNFFEMYLNMLYSIRNDEKILSMSRNYFKKFKQKLSDCIKKEIERGIIREDVDPENTALLITTCTEGHGLLSSANIYDSPNQKLEIIYDQIYKSITTK
ncbi:MULTISPECIES: TetR/AcrR family transcriptional regulator [Flammeovirga]|uniref:TetR/AcrR family transcriptional regulator n=1 Tax=Flammeovirga agarivorans TaxID=2726742 RepID=A0A7X8SH66_9BACT|nr:MULTISPECIES: TetR/AcrR family transcriptional regulator [Flammeovirga]NLR90052.1 TetR/AcrR family transcriptional regulator [Flammeovirga agarivorans]